MNENGRQEDEREGLLSKLLIATSQKLFEIEPWNLVLLLIFTVCTYAPNFIEIWKSGFQACPNLMWNFPVKIMQTCYLEYFENAWSCLGVMIVSPCKTLWCLYIRKNSTSSLTLCRRYRKDIANLLFWELWECLTFAAPLKS